jgi:hypothetical protein
MDVGQPNPEQRQRAADRDQRVGDGELSRSVSGRRPVALISGCHDVSS